jgi:hypothetical protein
MCFGMDKQFACFDMRFYSWITTFRSLEGYNTLFFGLLCDSYSWITTSRSLEGCNTLFFGLLFISWFCDSNCKLCEIKCWK